MGTTLSNAELKQVLDTYWEDIALFAYDCYHTKGKGVVGLEKAEHGEGSSGEQIQLLYAVYDFEVGKPDKDAARLIRAYDPEWEVIIQYVRHDGSVRTMTLKTAPGARHPWRIWIFNRMMQEDDIGGQFSDESSR